MATPTNINDILDDAITATISAFAIDQVDKMNKGTFTANDFQCKVKDTAIAIRKLVMQFRKANLI